LPALPAIGSGPALTGPECDLRVEAIAEHDRTDACPTRQARNGHLPPGYATVGRLHQETTIADDPDLVASFREGVDLAVSSLVPLLPGPPAVARLHQRFLLDSPIEAWLGAIKHLRGRCFL